MPMLINAQIALFGMILPLITIAIASVLTWSVLGAYFVFAQSLSRLPFILAHYAISIVSAGLFFFFAVRFFPHFSPFYTMITAMICLFIVELIVFNFFYKEELWFLNFVDWIVPVFIIASTIYFVTKYFG